MTLRVTRRSSSPLLNWLGEMDKEVLLALNRMPWFWRRILVIAIILWAMGLLTYIAVVEPSVRGDIGFYVSGVLISTVGSYLFGATWDNQNERRANLAASAIAPPAPTDSANVTTNIEVKP
ncbi:hypothetical protein EVC26_061 [Rhizobium phage RHph_I72]|nr:hypothetical protein EVC26_061 [Rhizobium phage RHph_I72]